MLESICGQSIDVVIKDYKTIYKLWKWQILKQDELDGDLKSTMTIELGGKLACY
jgi:hypothetical protein